jgi:putative transposase
MPDEVTLRIERPDGFDALSEAEWVAKLEGAVRLEEERAREDRRASGRGILGRKAVLRAEPTDAPKTTEPRRGLRPHLACLDKRRRIAELGALVAFRVQRHAALLRALKGERDVVFPHGTYRVRAFFLTAPPPLAICA